MSNIAICNHCQDLFKEEDVTLGEIKGFWGDVQWIHLCDECKSKLDEWLHPEETKIIKSWLKKGKKK